MPLRKLSATHRDVRLQAGERGGEDLDGGDPEEKGEEFLQSWVDLKINERRVGWLSCE